MKRSIAMKRGLIGLAVAGAFATPAAMAEVTISGAINTGIAYGKANAGTAPGNRSMSNTNMQATYSHVDIESVDDIGGGNKVIFHYQLELGGTAFGRLGEAGGAPGNRNTFLGIAGGWGAFKIGVNENVYERMMYTADPLDGAAGPGGNLNLLGTPGGAVFQVGQAQNQTGFNNFSTVAANCAPGPSGTSGCVDFYRRSSQTIWYESPNWSGFSFEVDQTLSAYKSDGPTPTNPTITSIGGKFQPESAPFYVDLSFERHKDMFGGDAIAGGSANGTGSKDDAFQIGGGYTIGDLILNLRFEQLKYTTDGSTNGISNYKRNAEWLGAKYNLPSGYVGGEVGIAQSGKTNVGTVADTGARLFAAGYFHNLSKQSQLQFIYSRIDNEKNATYINIGAPNGGLPGVKSDMLYTGLKHTF